MNSKPPAYLLDAADAFANKHGRTWKSELRKVWLSGMLSRYTYAPAELMRLKNYGPVWLRSYKPRTAAQRAAAKRIRKPVKRKAPRRVGAARRKSPAKRRRSR